LYLNFLQNAKKVLRQALSEMRFPVHKQRKVVPIRREGEFAAAERFLPRVGKEAKEKRGSKN